jgi:hypothetical protein
MWSCDAGRSARNRASSAAGVLPITHSALRRLSGWMNISIVPLLAQDIEYCVVSVVTGDLGWQSRHSLTACGLCWM